MGYQRLPEYQIGLSLFKVNERNETKRNENSKCRHFASVQVKQMVSMARFTLCVYPLLTQNEDIWNFHGSLTLNKGKLI